jgi:hypothetical protein
VRRCRHAIFAAAIAVLGGLALPAAASASSGDITIASITNSAGFMTVTTISGSPITAGSLKVHLFSNDKKNKDILDVTGFSPSGNSGSGDSRQSWQAQITGQLGPGIYPATADAADGNGQEDGLPGGNFSFRSQPEITLAATPASIDFDHQTVTFAGRAMQTPPTSSTPVPLSNQTIVIGSPASTADPNAGYTVKTSESGFYKLSVNPAPGSYVAAVAASSTMASARSPAATLTASADRVRLSARFRHPSVNYRRSDTISGTVKYHSGGTLKPLARTKVTISRVFPPGKRSTVFTDSAGNFTVTERHLTKSSRWTVTAGGTPLLGKAEVTRSLTVREETGFRHVDLKLTADRHLSVRACLVVTSEGRPGRPVNSPATLQYSARGAKGPWRKLATISPAGGSRYCAAGSPVWQARLTAPSPDASYRLRFGGSHGLQASSSKPVHLWRDSTRITSFTVTPRRVAAKGAITISGRLWRRTQSWHPYAHRKVAIQFKFRGNWYVFDFEPRTSSGGYFSGRFTVYASSRWRAVYGGDRTHFSCNSPSVKVTATSRHDRAVARGARLVRGA